MEGTQRLASVIRDAIASSGSISFAQFMEFALLDPDDGYYTGTRVRVGRSGDFITAPELHPILGAALARLAVATWERLERPRTFRWIEFGAGSGTLLRAAIEHLEREGSPLLPALEVQAIEANPFRRAELVAALAAKGTPVLDGAASDEPESNGLAVAGIVVANEFLDALPTHIVVGRRAAPNGFLERRVAIDPTSGALAWVEGDPDAAIAPALTARVAAHASAASPLAEGQLAEFSLAADAWVATLSSYLSRGIVAVIDYGREARELRDPSVRMAGTALAYASHRATGDLLGDPGERDLTAHVDLTALRAAAEAAGLTHVVGTTQAAFLASAGLDAEIARLRSGPEATLEGAIALRSALASLMDPRGMGGFAVELFATGSPSDRAALANPTEPLPGAAASIRRLV